MPRRYADRVPGLDRPGGRCCSRSGADCEARTAHCVSLSSDQNSASALPTAQFAASDVRANRGLIETSGLEWTFLRPGMFAANALSWWAPQIRVGDVVRWPYLATPTAPIDERDIAAVAVRAL